MESQIFDQSIDYSWSPEDSISQSVNTSSDLWPDYLWLDEYNPLSNDTKGSQGLDNIESGYALSNSSSPPEFTLPSPISDTSAFSKEDMFDQNSTISPLSISTTFDNDTRSAISICNSPLTENSPTISTPSLTLSPVSSKPNSPRNVERDTRTKRPSMRVQKHRQENSRAKTDCTKRQNAHNLIEKRYRNNLNSKINTLRDSIPSLNFAAEADEDGEYGMEGNDARRLQKCNKGIILDKAIEYIAELERQVESLSKTNAGLQMMVKGNIPGYLMLGLRC